MPQRWCVEVLTPAQRQALHITTTLFREADAAFLAGGTSLTLRFGHRRSRDLDWFTTAAFDHLALAERLQAQRDARVSHSEPGTIHAELGGIAISLIRYRYPVGAPDDFDGTPIASLRTIAGMKALAIVNRGYKRDFIDIAAMLGNGLQLGQMLEWAVADVAGLTMESCLRALAWREEAEPQPHPEGIDDRSWAACKQRLDLAIRGLVG